MAVPISWRGGDHGEVREVRVLGKDRIKRVLGQELATLAVVQLEPQRLTLPAFPRPSPKLQCLGVRLLLMLMGLLLLLLLMMMMMKSSCSSRPRGG